MTNQTWLNESLGSSTGIPDPTQPGETVTIVTVIQGFVQNDAGFSRADVSRYVNTALQNEAGDIWQGHAADTGLSEVWQARADALLEEDPSGAASALDTYSATLDAANDRYNADRVVLGEALTAVRQSKKVLLSPETCAWAVSLDHDSLLTTSMGVDVAAVYGANPSYVPAAAEVVAPAVNQVAEAETAKKLTVDFSREVEAIKSVATKAVLPSREIRRDPAAAAARRAQKRTFAVVENEGQKLSHDAEPDVA